LSSIPSVAPVRPFLAALALATAGGAAAAWVGMPLAWMIGAMIATGTAAISGAAVSVPVRLRSTMIMVLGIMLGGSFTPDIVEHVGRWSVTLAGLAAYVVIAGAAGTFLLRRVARLDPVTAYFTAMPGGLTEMVIAGGAMGGDDRTIALAHSMRVMLVVLVIPFWFAFVEGYQPGGVGPAGPAGSMGLQDMALLASAAAGMPIAAALRLPVPALLGPLLLSAALHATGLTEGQPPGILVATAQVVVGAAIGCRFAGTPPLRIVKVAGLALGVTALMLVLDVAAALILHHLTGVGMPALVLAYSPGGFAEMSLVALALHIDTAFVATHQIARILMVVMLAPLAFRLVGRRRSGDAPAG
jgi:membrane AbrB-like protein